MTMGLQKWIWLFIIVVFLAMEIDSRGGNKSGSGRRGGGARPQSRPSYRPQSRSSYRAPSRPAYRPPARPAYRPASRPSYTANRGSYNRGAAVNRGSYNRGGAVNRGSYNRGGAVNRGSYNRGYAANRMSYNRGYPANQMLYNRVGNNVAIYNSPGYGRYGTMGPGFHLGSALLGAGAGIFALTAGHYLIRNLAAPVMLYGRPYYWGQSYFPGPVEGQMCSAALDPTDPFLSNIYLQDGITRPKELVWSCGYDQYCCGFDCCSNAQLSMPYQPNEPYQPNVPYQPNEPYQQNEPYQSNEPYQQNEPYQPNEPYQQPKDPYQQSQPNYSNYDYAS